MVKRILLFLFVLLTIALTVDVTINFIKARNRKAATSILQDLRLKDDESGKHSEYLLTWTGSVDFSRNHQPLQFTFNGVNIDGNVFYHTELWPDKFRVLRGDTVKVVIPDEANIDADSYLPPMFEAPLYRQWTSEGVNVVYAHRGRVLATHVLTYEYPANVPPVIYVDDEKMGIGAEG